MDWAQGRPVAVRLPRRPWVEASVVGLAVSMVLLAALLPSQRPLLLSYMFLPVGVEAVLFGWRRGVILASSCILLILLPYDFPGIANSMAMRSEGFNSVATVTLWAASLVLSSVVVGHVSERGGTRAVAGSGLQDPLVAVEEERARVSHDIHDGVTQSMAAALMEAEILESITADSRPEIHDEVKRLKVIIASALTESRTMIGTLRPPPLDPAEFDGTLARLMTDLEERSGIDVDFSSTAGLAAHSYAMRICVYRLLQEALNNVEQHADADRVKVRIKELGAAVFVSVVDDGTGFELPDETTQEHHYGLRGMEERVEHLGGFLEIRTGAGEGTSVRAYIPGKTEGRGWRRAK